MVKKKTCSFQHCVRCSNLPTPYSPKSNCDLSERMKPPLSSLPFSVYSEPPLSPQPAPPKLPKITAIVTLHQRVYKKLIVLEDIFFSTNVLYHLRKETTSQHQIGLKHRFSETFECI